MDRKPFEDRFAALKQEADNWSPAWKDIQKFLCPTRGQFDDQTPNLGRTIDHKTILNGHANRGLNKLASGMTSGLTSPSRPWFKLGLADEDLAMFDPVKFWLDDIQQKMMAVFSRSNMYGVFFSIYAECGGFGTASAMILEDANTVIRGRNFTAGEYYFGTGPDSRTNAFARSCWYTVGQLVKEFGLQRVSESVRTRFQNQKVDEWVLCRSVIEPNDRRVMSPWAKDLPFRSITWEVGSPTENYLRLSGFHEFPIVGPRWETTRTSDVYGKSPGWDILGDVKMLQKMEKDKLIALDKLVDPPVQADGNVADAVNLLPGGLTRSSAVTPNSGVRPVYQVQPDLKSIELSIEKCKMAISEGLFTDLFMMVAQADRPNMTAREVVERHEEKLLMLGPVLERLESELLDPTIDRVFNIMLRAGIVPPPPEELQGQELKVEYISMLAQAQKLVGTTAIEQGVAFIGNLAAAKPQILDKLDEDAAVDAYTEMLGLPPKIIRSAEVVDKIRKDREQQQRAAEIAAAAPSMVQGAKVLSETKVGENSALDALLAGAAGTPAVGN